MYARGGRSRATWGLPVTDQHGRVIGRIVGREYRKLVTRADQMLHAPAGFAFDAWAMDRLVLPRVERLVVDCRVNGRRYWVDVETFQRTRIVINRGAGLQYALPLRYWHVAEGQEPATTAAPPPDDGPVQQRLL
jgi:hypothetical protein